MVFSKLSETKSPGILPRWKDTCQHIISQVLAYLCSDSSERSRSSNKKKKKENNNNKEKKKEEEDMMNDS